MGALSAPSLRHTRDYRDRANYVIKDASVVYPGGIVGRDSSGRILPWSDTAGLQLVGLVDSIVGGGDSGTGNAGGTVAATVLHEPILERVAVTGASTEASVGALVYATSDNDLTLTQTNAVRAIGYINKFHTSTQFDVKLFSTDGQIGFSADVENLVNIASATAGVPILIRQTVVAGTATYNIFSSNAPRKLLIIDAWCYLTAAGGAADTLTVDNGVTAITDAIDLNDADNTISRASTIDDAQNVIAAGGSLRIVTASGPACEAFIVAIPIA